MVGRVESLGFDARAGIADTPGAAWGITRFGKGRTQIIAPGATRDALGDLPVAALRLPASITDGLDGLGLRRVRDLYDLPRGPLAARFGARVADRLDAALNPGSEPVSPLVAVPECREQMAFAEPIGLLEDIERGLAALLVDLCLRMDRQSVGARRVDFILYRVDGGVSRARIGTSRPTRDAHHLARLFAEQIVDLDLGLGVEAMAVSVPNLEPLVPEQMALADRTQPGQRDNQGIPDPASIAPLVDRLINRLGSRSVMHLAQRQSHIPEHAAAEIPAADDTGKSDAWADASVPGRGSRPLRLFPRPQSIQAVAPVPDGPPALFRWRRVLHRVARAEGPERIAPEWWRTSLPWDSRWEAATRDYYRVEDDEGRRFWLYRKGLYSGPDGQPLDVGDGQQPTWFIHGQFA
ncbi:MAG: DNA polymerase Y family protein [Alphaproteobacteria bacterium]|nr:DNA polymerase Y family protein [Alphaproteobacteria bacterium]